MENRNANLQSDASELKARVEGSLARHSQNLPPPPQIAQVSFDAAVTTTTTAGGGVTTAGPYNLGTGYLLDFDGTSYRGDPALPEVTVYPPSGEFAVWRPQSQRWEWLAGGGLYVAVPPCGQGIPAAVLGGTAGDVPGRAGCCLFRLVFDPTHTSAAGQSKQPNQLPYGPGYTLEPLLDAGGNAVRETVFNIYPFAVSPSEDAPFIRIARDRHGNWLSEPWLGAGSGGTSTTTTAGNAGCQGMCQFVWSAAANQWLPSNYGCNTTTTTTTTTTTAAGCGGTCTWTWGLVEWAMTAQNCTGNACGCGTGPTISGPASPQIEPCVAAPTTTTACLCSGGPTTTSTTTTTTGCPCLSHCTPTTWGGITTTSTTPDPSTTTTTTTACPCCPTTGCGQCIPPSHCGDNDGDCTYTWCSTLVFPPQPCCATSTTTTCDCSTSTSAPANCTCPTTPGGGGGGGGGGSAGGGSVGTQSGGGGCFAGTCAPGQFGLACCNGQWQVSNSCLNGAVAPPPPPGSCTCTGGSGGVAQAPQPCGWVPTTPIGGGNTPTTPEPGGAMGGGAPPCSLTTTTTASPCAHCYTSTTSTTTTATCAGDCKWKCQQLNGGQTTVWTLAENNCQVGLTGTGNCVCYPPAVPCQGPNCQVAWTNCGTTTTSSTTTSSTTTSSTTTSSTTTSSTTTTTSPCGGYKNYVWTGSTWQANGGIGCYGGGCAAGTFCVACPPNPFVGIVAGDTATSDCACQNINCTTTTGPWWCCLNPGESCGTATNGVCQQTPCNISCGAAYATQAACEANAACAGGTTTTPSPCASCNCQWTWTGSTWNQTAGCNGTSCSGCTCPTPGFNGTTMGQTQTMACT